MNRRQADAAIGLLVAVVVLGGVALTWQALQRRPTTGGVMGGGSMMDGTMHGTDPFWYVLGTLLVAVVIVGFYLVVRRDIPGEDAAAADGPAAVTPQSKPETTEMTETAETEPQPQNAVNPEEQPRERVLDLLPEDERRVLEPVLASPGITQIELRDRSEFSKSKVSQTVSDLEKRGLLYRERQGRTYRVYPSDELAPGQV